MEVKRISTVAAALFLFCGCAPKSGEFFAGALGLEKDRVFVTSQLATVLTVTAYDLEGRYLSTIADYQTEANGPRGLAYLDPTHILLSLDGDDRIDILGLGGSRGSFVQSSLFTGTIGRILRHPDGDDFFVVEGNNAIERFSASGSRRPVSGNAFVQGALAPCAAPTSLRSLVVNSDGQLLALQSAAATGFRYTIGPSTAASCVAIAALPANVNDVVNHSDGNLYWAGTNSQIYRASQTMTGSVSIFNNSATIGTPTAMAELPNGDLLIAADASDSLQVIGTDGNYRGTFHKGVHTQQIHSILVVRGQ